MQIWCVACGREVPLPLGVVALGLHRLVSCPVCGGVTWRTTDADPTVPYVLWENDKLFLQRIGVAWEEP